MQGSSGEIKYWFTSNFGFISNLTLTDDMYDGRHGNTTRGKRKGIKFIIKVL